jgi:4-hydroxybenzoate polyprenyltransferase
VFAAVAAPVHSVKHLLNGLLWIWLHLLQCNISNQYKTPEEDIVSRPWRPIPSGRISPTNAFSLRIFLVPVCLGLSWFHSWGVFFTSATLTATMVVYDEVGFADHWAGKNLCNVFGYLTFEIGATKIMGMLTYQPCSEDRDFEHQHRSKPST